MEENVYKKLGIPNHKFYLLLFKDYYRLKSNYHNFYIIFTHDIKLIFLTNDFKNEKINEKKYIKEVRKHFIKYYGLQIKNLRKLVLSSI